MADIVLLTSRSRQGELTHHGRLLREAQDLVATKRFGRTLPSSGVAPFLRGITTHDSTLFVDADTARKALSLLNDALEAAVLADVLSISAKGVMYDDALVRTQAEGTVDGKLTGWREVEVGLSRASAEHRLQQPAGAWCNDAVTIRARPRTWVRWGKGWKKKVLREQPLRFAMVPFHQHPHWLRLLEVVESRPDATFRWTPA